MFEIDPEMFRDCVDMDTAIAAAESAGVEQRVGFALRDLSRSGVYHMAETVDRGGYTMFNLNPLIAVGAGRLISQEMHFGATLKLPKLADRISEMGAATSGGRVSLKNGELVSKRRAWVARALQGVAFKALDLADMTPLEDIVALAKNSTPTGMIGGVIGALHFKKDGQAVYGSFPFWHRSLPQWISPNDMGQAPEFIMQKLRNAGIEDESKRAGIVLGHLFSRAEVLDPKIVDVDVNFLLPPKRRIDQ
jgi:hypothetical protein